MAPSTGPSRVVRPPIATPIRKAIDGRMPTCDGLMKPTIGANSAPAMLANSAATVYATTLMLAGS